MIEPVKTTEDLATEPKVRSNLLPADPAEVEHIEPYAGATEVDLGREGK